MRKPTSVEVMLLSAIGLWALNLTVSRYILTHGFQPLAYSTVRYGLASLVFIAIALVAERSLRIERRDLGLVFGAAVALFVNQIGFVYALKTTSASVIALILAATPIFAALIGLAFGTEVLPRRFWAGAALSFAGVALVALGAGGEIGGDAVGILLGILTAATWAVYSILITPLMARYSPSRISAVVLPLSWVGIAWSACRRRARRTGASAGRSGCCSCSRCSGRSSSPTSSGSTRLTGSAPRGPRSRPTCSRSLPRSAPSSCSGRRSTSSRSSAGC